MTAITATLRAALAATLTLALAATAYAGAEQDVDRVEDARYTAMINGDIGAFSDTIATEFVYYSATGRVYTKASYIEMLKGGDVKIKRAERYGVTIQVYGDVATGMGETIVDLEVRGEPKRFDLRYLNVWVNRDGRWQLAARQSAFKPAK